MTGHERNIMKEALAAYRHERGERSAPSYSDAWRRGPAGVSVAEAREIRQEVRNLLARSRKARP